jgi:hypothetical protein
VNDHEHPRPLTAEEIGKARVREAEQRLKEYKRRVVRGRRLRKLRDLQIHPWTACADWRRPALRLKLHEMSVDYSPVADDIEWLRDEWWQPGNDPSEGHIRRGSAAIDLLLRQGLLGRAWRHFGFAGGEPTIEGPDVLELLKKLGFRAEMAIGVVAGGGRVGQLEYACVGAFRVDNSETGIPAHAKEGFAVAVTSIVKDSRQSTPGDLDGLVCRQWRISEFLRSPGAIRKGTIITRGAIIDYFRNYAGGAHADLLAKAINAKTDSHQLIHEMAGRVHTDIREGLHFELLSIGQAIARSPAVAAIVQRIRAN